jgi:heme exporter protein A
MLEGRGLTCVRHGRRLFENLDFHLNPGNVLQVEGVNGAGKTSLLRIVCGLAHPRDGVVRWAGENIRRCRADYHRNLLHIGHNPGIKQELTAAENLRFFHCLGGHGTDAACLDEALDQIGLYGYEDVAVKALSAGQRRRVALARLWLSRAPLWILDEPFTAIDRQGIGNLEQRLAQHVACDGMVVLTTHQPLVLHPARVQHLLIH